MRKSRDKQLKHFYCDDCDYHCRFFSAIMRHFEQTGHWGYKMKSPEGKLIFHNKPTKEERQRWRKTCNLAGTIVVAKMKRWKVR